MVIMNSLCKIMFHYCNHYVSLLHGNNEFIMQHYVSLLQPLCLIMGVPHRVPDGAKCRFRYGRFLDGPLRHVVLRESLVDV